MTRTFVAILVVATAGCRANAPAATAGAPSNPTRAATPAAKKDVPVSDLRLDLLKNGETELGPADRNPFQFKPKAAPPPPKPTTATGRGASIVIGPPPGPVGPPPPPPITLKYIGVLGTTQGKVAIFRDTGGDIVNGKEGDIIDGRYRLLKIGVESADLAYVDGRGRQTIRLSGQ
jgi:hypothetical protein